MASEFQLMLYLIIILTYCRLIFMNEENNNGTIFSQDSSIKKTKPYNFKELFKARMVYYIICAFLIIAGVSLCIADVVVADQKKYSDYLTISKKEDQLNRSFDRYYIFYYLNDKKCNELKPTLFDYADINDIGGSKYSVPIYFASINSLFSSDEKEPDSFTDIDNYNDLIVKTSGTLLLIDNKKVKSSTAEDTVIKESLRLKDYADYKENTINSASEQLNRPEEEYYVYYYTKSCAACKSISQAIFFYLESDNTKLYLVNLDIVSEIIGEKREEGYKGITDYRDITIKFTPSLLKIKNGSVELDLIEGSGAVEAELFK